MMDNRADHGIETYPVGLLSDVKRRRGWRYSWRYLRRQAERRNWRAVRNYFNGYLAEWSYPPVENFRSPGNCGKGWTRKAALRDLGRKVVAANLSDRELMRP